MKNQTLKILCLLITGIFSFSIVSNAQVSTAIVEGTIMDDQGSPLPGVMVSAKNVETGFGRATTSRNDGFYRIMALPPGTYSLTAMLSSFKTEIKKNITLSVGRAFVINFELLMSPIEETIVVESAAPLVQTTKSEIGQIVGSKRIRDLPLDGRDFLELAELAPGVSPSTGFGGGLTSIGAASFRNVAFNIDGLDVTDVVTRGGFGFFTSEVVREFQVITNRFSAEYGRSLSGVVNVITRSGTNEWHGDFYSYFRDEKLDNPRWLFDYTDMDFKEEEEKAKYSQQQYGFSLGGPIVKDKTHIFLHYEGWNNAATSYVTADPAWSYPGIDISDEVGQFPSTYKANQVFIKLNHQISPKHYLQVSYSLNTGRSRNVYVGGFSTEKFGASVEFDEHLFFISETFSISDRAVNEFRFQYGQRRNDWIPNDRNPSIYQYTAYGVITSSGSHPSVDQTNLTKRIQLKNDFYLTLPGTKTGEHNLKIGFDLQFLHGDHDTAYSKNGYYVIWYGAPYYYIQAFGQSAYKFNENVYGVYLQDDWKINRHLTLNLGVRWDYNSFAPEDKDNISPRLGFAIDPGGKGRTVIRGGLGIYHDMAFTQLLQTVSALGADGMATITFYPGTPLYPTDWENIDQLPAGVPAPARSIYAIDPAFNNAYSLQTSLGFSKQIGNDFSISVDGVYNRGYNLIRIRDLNAPTEFHGPYPAGWEGYYGDFYRPQIPVPDGFRSIDQFESTGRSNYKALLVNLTKRLSHNFSFQLSYTLAKARDNLGYGGDYVSRPADSLDMDAEWGYSLNDIRHTIAFNGLYYLPYGFSIGGIYLAYSARPYTAQLGYDYNGDGNANDRPAGIEKNTLRGKSFHKLDLFLGKTFRLSSLYLILRAEAFNILNIRNVAGFGSVVDTLTYQIATAAYAPRVFQLSVRVSF